jgi:Holliday junction DNA helicase RuvA
MIEYIEGNFTIKTPTYIVVDAGGVGYKMNVSLHTYEKVASKSGGRLLAHPVYREDSQDLFGFFNESERELFRQLISISGVGPNTARMMLSSLSPDDLRRAIIRGDVSLIKTVKGVGPKSAQRIVVELQDVLTKTTAPEVVSSVPQSRAAEEALAAMTMLGFTRIQAEKAISGVLREQKGEMTVEELIKQALKTI